MNRGDTGYGMQKADGDGCVREWGEKEVCDTGDGVGRRDKTQSRAEGERLYDYRAKSRKAMVGM